MGDLHTQEFATAAIDQVGAVTDAMKDFDDQFRPTDNNADIGADEFSTGHDLMFEQGFESL